jgi:acyl-CoA hydrolase
MPLSCAVEDTQTCEIIRRVSICVGFLSDTESRSSDTDARYHEHANSQDGHLDEGCLLRWLDLATCACAERHTRVNCVTASVSDLHFHDALSSMTAIGFVITVSATPVRTGNTSLDIHVTATVENPNTGENRTVCSAFFTYVTCRGPDGIRPKVPKLSMPAHLGDTNDDWLAFMQLERQKLIPSMKSTLEPQSTEEMMQSLGLGSASSPLCSAPSVQKESPISTSRTNVEILELCLPTNLNHMSHTFGGEVMRWMMKTALVCASRHLGRSVIQQSGEGGASAVGKERAQDRAPVTFRSVAMDNISFIDSSDKSDHIIFRARINRVFSDQVSSECEVEVGVFKWSLSAGKECPINTGAKPYSTLNPKP